MNNISLRFFCTHFLFLECLAPAIYIRDMFAQSLFWSAPRNAACFASCYIQYFALSQFVRFFTTLTCAWSDKLVTFTIRIRLLNTLNLSTLHCVRLFACDVIGHFDDLNCYSIENDANKVRDWQQGSWETRFWVVRTWVWSRLFSASHLSCFRFRSCYDKSKQKRKIVLKFEKYILLSTLTLYKYSERLQAL